MSEPCLCGDPDCKRCFPFGAYRSDEEDEESPMYDEDDIAEPPCDSLPDDEDGTPRVRASVPWVRFGRGFIRAD